MELPVFFVPGFVHSRQMQMAAATTPTGLERRPITREIKKPSPSCATRIAFKRYTNVFFSSPFPSTNSRSLTLARHYRYNQPHTHTHTGVCVCKCVDMCLCVNLSGRNAAAVAPLSLSWFDYVSHFSYRVFTGLQRFFYGAYRTRNGLGMGLVDVLFLIESNDTRAASPRMFPILFESTRMIWSDVDFFYFALQARPSSGSSLSLSHLESRRQPSHDAPQLNIQTRRAIRGYITIFHEKKNWSEPARTPGSR